jgi:NAD(P) transhydrogenase subunit alpha
MYAKNVAAFLGLITRDGRPSLDEGDEIVRATLVTSGGHVVHRRVLEALEGVRDV